MKLLGILVAGLIAAPAFAQTPEIDAILDKAGDYVAAYERTFAGVVAEETYRQQVQGGRGRNDARGFPVETPGQRRDLKSDVLLVRAPAGDRWIQFRDVFEVDGKPVRDRAERLSKLFLQPSASVQQQVDDIAASSARYNIGGVNRNVNLPVLALTVLEARNRAWFSFKGRKAGNTFELEFQEERTGTLIRTAGDQAMPSRGRFTIDAVSGSVLSSELIAESGSLRARIEVTYALDPGVNVLVPREMREKYVLRDGSTVEGKATYAKYRRYQVTVDTAIK
jgi:hypothetical protein